jgi:flavin reductase (DIM6/NTAB) family NADH-FMN oxidoreductase RutF
MTLPTTTPSRPAPGPVEQGDPAGDARSFRRALGQFATGVTVVATSYEGEVVGMAANSFSAVSLDPPLVLWSIRKESSRCGAFSESGHFSVNVLADDQMDVSSLFGRPQPGQFDQAEWSPGTHGDPLVAGAIAQFECVTHDVLDGGDHVVLVGRVERFARFEGAPLLFAQGQYGVFETHPGLEAGPSAAPGTRYVDSEDSLFMSLLRAADHHMSALFQGHRQEVGVTVATGRILNRLARGPASLDVLEDDSYLGENAAEDAIAELAAQGHVVEEPGVGWTLTTSGAELRRTLRASAEQFTADQLRGIPRRDLEAAERVLSALLGRGTRSEDYS